MLRFQLLTPLLLYLCLISAPGTVHAETLTVGILDNFPPQYVLDNEGKPDGLAVDFFENIVTETDFQTRYRIYESWDSLQEGLRKGEVDLIPNMGIADPRREWASFSKPLESFQIYLFVRKGNRHLRFPQDFRTQKLGIVHLNIGEKIAARHPGLHTRIYPDVFDAFYALLAGHVDGVIFPRPTFYKVALESGLENRIETAGEPLQEMKRGLAVAKGNESLLEVFNPIISRFVPTDDYKDIYAHWYGSEAPYWSARRVLIFALAAIVLIVGALLFWRYKSMKNLTQALRKDVERKTHELLKSEKKYRAMYENASLPYQSMDEEGRILDVNREWLSILGYARHEVKGQWFGDFLHPDSLSTFEKKFAALKKHGFTQKVSYRIRHSEGYYLEISLDGCVAYSDERVFQHTYCVFHNVTAQKESERTLRRERNFTQSIIDTAQIIILVLDLEGRIRKVNPYLEQITGYAADEVIGLDWFSNFIPLKDQDSVKEVFEKEVRDIHVKGQLNTILNRNGEEIWVEWSNETLRDPDDGATVGMLAIGQDISDRIEAEQRQRELEVELRQKHKMEAVGIMAGGIAHNFNNSLAIIIGNIELALVNLEDGNKAVPYLDKAKVGVSRSRDLVRKILAYSRQGEQEIATIRFGDIMDESLGLLESTLPSSINLRKHIDTEAENLHLNGNASQVEEILLNLCNNAVQAMNEIGTLEVAAETLEVTSEDIPANYTCTPGRYARISVSDSGCGIPDEMCEKLFDPFFTTKKAHEGTGMGLATVQGLVLQHGGFICVESCVGEGSTFRIYLPVVEETVTEEQIVPTDSSLPGGTEQILYVDDEEMLAELAEDMLTPAGYEVTIMIDSNEALKLFRENAERIDLLITDQTMPGLTGTELIAEFKKIKPEIPVILCTGHSSKVNIQNAHEQGVHAYLEKPITQEQLLQRVRQVLDESK